MNITRDLLINVPLNVFFNTLQQYLPVFTRIESPHRKILIIRSTTLLTASSENKVEAGGYLTSIFNTIFPDNPQKSNFLFKLLVLYYLSDEFHIRFQNDYLRASFLEDVKNQEGITPSAFSFCVFVFNKLTTTKKILKWVVKDIFTDTDFVWADHSLMGTNFRILRQRPFPFRSCDIYTFFQPLIKFLHNPTNCHVTSLESPCTILSYSTRVESVLSLPNTKAYPLFGIELELDNCDSNNLTIAHSHLKSHCIFKRDGSVPNGVEIVSVPDSVANHKEKFKPFFESKHGLKANSNCGIHIHVSRRGTSFLLLGRMLAFFSANKSFIEHIAGRSSTYAKITKWEPTSPWYSVESTTKYDHPKFRWDKYTGINLAPNNTVEFRIFKSTTNFEEFCMFLEFVESFVSFQSLAGDDNAGKIRTMKDMLNKDNYMDFVFARASVFPNLAKFLRKEFK